MAYTQTLVTLLIFSLLPIFYAQHDELPKPTAIYLPILKNASTHQYYARFGFDTQGVDALIDLGAQSVWFDCTTYRATLYRRVSCGSDQCQKAKDTLCVGTCRWTPELECQNNTCGVYAYNPYREYTKVQEFGKEMLMVTSTDGKAIKYNHWVGNFLLSCAESIMVEGFPGDHTKGLVGLGRNQASLHSQITSYFGLVPKFALCLPSSLSSEINPGAMIIGGGPYYMPPSLEDQSSSLVRTPLAGDSNEYFIHLNDIEIDGQRVALGSSLLSGGAKISTVVPYTTLHASIYKRLIKDYVKAAALKNIKRVTNVEPFGACFDSTTIPKTITGPAVPDVDLVMPGNMVSVKMKLSGSNLMVEVKKDVICLAIIDGGAEPRTSVVLGGHQLEDRLLVFDLSTSILSFTPSLLLSNTSCSHSRVF